MGSSRNFHAEIINYLKDSQAASSYLTTAFEEGDKKVFLLALRNVVEAHGGVSKLSRLTKLNREHLYKLLSKNGNPEIYTLGNILHALGLRLAVLSEEKKHFRRAA